MTIEDYNIFWAEFYSKHWESLMQDLTYDYYLHRYLEEILGGLFQ